MFITHMFIILCPYWWLWEHNFRREIWRPVSLSPCVNCSFLSCTDHTSVSTVDQCVGKHIRCSNMGSVCWLLFGLLWYHLCWWWQGQRNLPSTWSVLRCDYDAFYCPAVQGSKEYSFLDVACCLHLKSGDIGWPLHSAPWHNLSSIQDQGSGTA